MKYNGEIKNLLNKEQKENLKLLGSALLVLLGLGLFLSITLPLLK